MFFKSRAIYSGDPGCGDVAAAGASAGAPSIMEQTSKVMSQAKSLLDLTVTPLSS